jgi:U3 small nucleolar RNA-associated protein 14
MTDNNQLWFVVETEEVEEKTKVTGERGGEDMGGGFGESELVETVKTLAKRKRVSLDAQALKAQMSSMLAILDEVFTEANTRTGLQLDEVELSVEINAEGQLSIVGNGGKLGNTGGMTLKFTRPTG